MVLATAEGEDDIPSVLVTTGRLVLVSLGEDMFELWGEVRAV